MGIDLGAGNCLFVVLIRLEFFFFDFIDMFVWMVRKIRSVINCDRRTVIVNEQFIFVEKFQKNQKQKSIII